MLICTGPTGPSEVSKDLSILAPEVESALAGKLLGGLWILTDVFSVFQSLMCFRGQGSGQNLQVR